MHYLINFFESLHFVHETSQLEFSVSNEQIIITQNVDSFFFYLKKVSQLKNGKREIHNVVNNMKMIEADEILNQFPLKMLIKHILKRLKHK